MKAYTVSRVQHYPTYQVLSMAPVDGESGLEFWPGQYAAIAFKSGGLVSPMRCFSMINAPAGSELQFAMRTHGRFTRKVACLQAGDTVRVQGPYGNFVLDPTDQHIVLLAAGIGITPFMSIVHAATEARDNRAITLLYACRSANDMPFAAELRQLQRQNPKFRVVFVTGQGAHNAAQNIYGGRIDEALLAKVTGDEWQSFTFFLCGPSAFTSDMQSILNQHVAEDQVITESFTQGSTFGWRLNRLTIPTMTYALTGLLLILGIGTVMGLDLLRVLPKAKAAATITKSSASTAAGTTNTASSDTTAADNTSTSANSTSTQPAPTPTPTTTTTTQSYRAPVTSVS